MRALEWETARVRKSYDKAKQDLDAHVVKHGEDPQKPGNVRKRKNFEKAVSMATKELSKACASWKAAQPAPRVMPTLLPSCILTLHSKLDANEFDIWRVNIVALFNRSQFAEMQEGVFCWSQALPPAIEWNAKDKDTAAFVHGLVDLPWAKALEAIRERFVKLADPMYECSLFLNLKQREDQDLQDFNDEFNRLVRASFREAAPSNAWMEQHLIYSRLYLDKLDGGLLESIAEDSRYYEPALPLGLKEVQELAVSIIKEQRRSLTVRISQDSEGHDAGARKHQKGKRKRGEAAKPDTRACRRCGSQDHLQHACQIPFQPKNHNHDEGVEGDEGDEGEEGDEDGDDNMMV